VQPHALTFIKPIETPIDAVQDFLINTSHQQTQLGFTLGLGLVWRNRWQVDLAFVKDGNQYQAYTLSTLYRFGSTGK
jgi:hypothetical protein